MKKTPRQLDREIAAFVRAPSSRIRRPAAHNPMVWRKTKMPEGTVCQERRHGAPCGGFIKPGESCPVCASDRMFEEMFIGYPEDH